MSTALIGYTGFVGGTLLRQHRFDALFNSKNIDQIAGQRFDSIVCAGAPAEKWKANENPEADWRALERLTKQLCQAEAERLILISTVDVYSQPTEVTEADEPAGATPYGAHRHALEKTLAERFPTLVVRLPALFGTGLKKNAVYDLLNGNQVDRIDSRACYQFYGLERLWADIKTADCAGLELVNFATEPVSIGEVVREAFGGDFQNEVSATPARYDIRTQHSHLFGGTGGYIESRLEVLEGLRRFVAMQRQEKRCA